MSSLNLLVKQSSSAALLSAVSSGVLSATERVFRKRGKSILNLHGADGCTPLLLACKRGHKELVEFFLANGASVNDTDKDPKRQGNALHYASWGGHLELVNYLIDERSASLDSRDIVGNTPLLYAVYGGHLHVVKEFVRRGRSIRERNSKNHTAILQASCGGHLELVEWLLEQDFDLAETDNDGNTSLLFAAWGGHKSLIQYLISRGSSLTEKNANGHSVFLSAANGGRVEVVEWLLTQNFHLSETNHNGDTALLLAAYGGHKDLVERLLELGASLNERNSCGFSPLLSAANGGQLEMSQWLLDNGSSLDECDNDGYTALILAACGGNVELVKFFMEQGASLSERNNNGDTALLLASYCGHKDLVEWLLLNGSDINEKNMTGMGVLISAANGGHLEVVDFIVHLLDNDAVEEVDEGGYTPYLLAVQRGHFAVAQYLAAYGCNIHARTLRHDNSALQLAMDQPDLMEYLVLIDSWTPLQIAIEGRMVDRVHDLLLSGIDPRDTPAGTPSCLAIATTVQNHKNAKPICRETAMLVQHALRSWRPSTHGLLFGTQFTESIQLLAKVQSICSADVTLPYLPNEIWLHIMSFVQRSWFPEAKQNQAIISVASDSTLSRQLSFWRKERLMHEPVLIEEISEEDEQSLLQELEEDGMALSAQREGYNPESRLLEGAQKNDKADFSETDDDSSSVLSSKSGSLTFNSGFRVTWV